jgi:hypothetical protein
MDIEKDIHVPDQLLNLRVHNFPFKGDQHRVLNFLIQGIVVFIVSAWLGFEVGHHIIVVCS